MPLSPSLRTGDMSDMFRSIINLVSNQWFQEVGMLLVFAGIFISGAKLFLPDRMTQATPGKF